METVINNVLGVFLMPPPPQEPILRTVSFTISGHIATTLGSMPGMPGRSK